MARSVTVRLGEPNPALRTYLLPSREGKMALSCPLGITCTTLGLANSEGLAEDRAV